MKVEAEELSSVRIRSPENVVSEPGIYRVRRPTIWFVELITQYSKLILAAVSVGTVISRSKAVRVTEDDNPKTLSLKVAQR